jgi:hypothetical protein
MIIPVRLYRNAAGEICDMILPGQSGQVLAPVGISMPDAEAKRLGITAYLEQRTSRLVTEKFAALKAVEKVEVEDKSVDKDEVEDKGIMIDRSRVNPIPAVVMPPPPRPLGEDDPGRRPSGGRRG